MKTILQNLIKASTIAAVSLSLLFTPGCGTPGGNQGLIQVVTEAKPYIRVGANVACQSVFNYAVSDSDKVVKAKCMYGIAVGVRSLSGGTLPTPEELNTTLQSFAINDGQQWVGLAKSLQDLYAEQYAKLTNSDDRVQAGLIVLEAIASGIEDAAATYLK